MMSPPPNLAAQLEAHRELVALRATRPLTAEESQRLELLSDLLLEARVELDVAEGIPRRPPRAPVNLDVSFTTPNDAARALVTTRDIGAGGMSFNTNVEMTKGTVLSLSIRIPGWPDPFQVSAEVMWSKGGAVGLAFKSIDPAIEKRLKALITEHSSFLGRLGASLGARKAPVNPLVSERQRVVLVRLRDTALSDSTTRAVRAAGFSALVASQNEPPVAIVADSSSAFEMTEKFPGVPLILVHVTGPESLVGRLSSLVPAAFIPRPATDETILAAVLQVAPKG